MKFEPVPLSEAKGKILGHNIAGADGQRMLRKGRPLTSADLESLRVLGRDSVYVAQLEVDDLDENTAARRIAQAVCGTGLDRPGVSAGRANLLAKEMGIVRVDVDRLAQLNTCDGLTLATLQTHSPVHARQMVATVKIIPYAVPGSVIRAAEEIAAKGEPIVRVDSMPPQSVGLILSGSTSLQQRLLADFAPLGERIEKLGSLIIRTDFVSLDDESDETLLADMLKQQLSSGARLILLAGETAIMDAHDIVPRAVERAGGHVESVGAPVDPGNLLMLAYLDGVPIVGAPGCARSRKMNIVDWILPRLLAGDKLSRRDIIGLGHGGLMQDLPERVMPRDIQENNSGLPIDSEPSSVEISSGR